MNKRTTNIILLVLAAVLLLFLLSISMIANGLIDRQLEENVSERLVAAVEPNRSSLDLLFGEQIEKVKAMAAYFADAGTLGDESQINLMRIAVREYELLNCTIFDANGDYITYSGITGNMKDKEFFTDAMQGNFNISDPQQSLVGGSENVIALTSPIVRGDEIVGALSCSYLCKDINRIFSLNFLDGAGQIMVIDKSGSILISGGKAALSQGDNALQYLRDACIHANHKPGDCIPVVPVDSTRSVFSIHTQDKRQSMLVSYEKLPYNDWYMLALAPMQAINKTIFAVSDMQRSLMIVVFGCILLYLLVFILIRLFLIRHLNPLTKLPRLEYFKLIAKRLLKKNKDKRYIVVRLDIRNLKLINRIYSMQEGDRVIRNMALSFQACLKDSVKARQAAYAHVDTDVFVAILPFRGREHLGETRQKFISGFQERMGEAFSTHTVFPTGQYITDRNDAENTNMTEILEKATFAHSLAKRENGDVVVDYETNIEKEALLQKEIEDKMDLALQNNEYKLYLQPKFRLEGRVLCGAEALVRWHVDNRYFMHPAEFIPALERNGFIVKLDMYMFEHTVAFIRALMDKGISPVPISVNFSRHHLNDQDFVKKLLQVVKSYGVSPHLLEVELTESIVFENVNRINQILTELHAAGFRLAMDDFGSGYSSLGLLKDLQVDVIKIDKGFFTEDSDSARSRVVLGHVFSMASELKTETVAEGVELAEQVEMLEGLGCDVVQGYYFSKPVPAEAFKEKYFTGK